MGSGPGAITPRSTPSNRVVGSPARAVAQLDELVAATGADEIMVSTVAHGLATRLRSLELLASAWKADGTAG